MKAYKLTDEKDRTYGGCQWGEGVTHETDGAGELCGPGWIHYYDDPLLAVFLNSIHANFKNPHLWGIEVGGEIKGDRGLKFGATKVTTIKRISLPAVTTEQCIKFAILCALKVYQEPSFVEWANNWLNGDNRTAYATNAAAYAADAAAYAANAAAYAADAAAYAANAAAHAANAAYAAADAAAHAAYAAATVRRFSAAANTAVYAANAADIDLKAIAHQAIQD